MQQQITPDQIPSFLAAQRAQLAETLKVLEIKREIIQTLDQMEGHIAAADFIAALACYATIQRREYELQIQAFEERMAQINDLIRQLETAQAGIVLPRLKVPRA